MSEELVEMPSNKPEEYLAGVEVIKKYITLNFPNDDEYKRAMDFANSCQTKEAALAKIDELKEKVSNDNNFGGLYTKLKEAGEQANTTEEFNAQVLDFCQNAIITNPDQATTIKTMCGVAMGSYEYWTTGNNLEDWMHKTDPTANPPALTSRMKWMRFGLADLCGSTGGIEIGVICSGLEAQGWD